MKENRKEAEQSAGNFHTRQTLFPCCCFFSSSDLFITFASGHDAKIFGLGILDGFFFLDFASLIKTSFLKYFFFVSDTSNETGAELSVDSKCHLCGKVFDSLGGFMQHVEKDHGVRESLS